MKRLFACERVATEQPLELREHLIIVRREFETNTGDHKLALKRQLLG